ncbi:MAG: hypothetical protein KG003_01235 [Bacteroidetes bacterium]|nr:hypothetical protein [Bacteroidota bacterium]
MNTAEANQLLDKLTGDIEKNGINPEANIATIQKIREFALKENDPLVTRALRLLWQHLESNNAFELSFLEEAETQEENLLYMLSLCRKSENTYNRDELREMTNMLQEMA